MTTNSPPPLNKKKKQKQIKRKKIKTHNYRNPIVFKKHTRRKKNTQKQKEKIFSKEPKNWNEYKRNQKYLMCVFPKSE